jgi:hypothetical protein
VPVTIAHPIAAIPLRRPLGRVGVLSALVIGSLVPDLPLYLPLPLRRETHTLFALLWFCLPVGLLAYVLFDRVLDQPLRALLPEQMQMRLPAEPARRPAPWTPAVVISILVGAATHSAWDAFTHGGSTVMRLIPALETRLFTVSGYTAYVFSVLQHASSVAGTIAMMAVIVRWYRTAPRHPLVAPPGLSAKIRPWLLAMIAVVVGGVVIAGGVSRFPDEPTLRALQPFARRLIVAGLSSLVVTVTLYALVWHWVRLRAARTA